MKYRSERLTESRLPGKKHRAKNEKTFKNWPKNFEW